MPEERTERFTHKRLRRPSAFKPGSFVTITQGEHKIVAGVLKGERRKIEDGPNRGKLKLTTQAVLHPVSEGNPCATCEVERLNRR